jgi:CRP-like cAMP-binding protein
MYLRVLRSSQEGIRSSAAGSNGELIPCSQQPGLAFPYLGPIFRVSSRLLYPHLRCQRRHDSRWRTPSLNCEAGLQSLDLTRWNLSGPSPQPETFLLSIENQLIANLPRKSRLSLMKLCEPVQLRMADVLCDGGKPIRHVYFPLEGFISLVTLLDGKPVLEVGMVGREGMLGAQMALGAIREPLHAVVQGPGSAWRIGKLAFRRELDHNSALQQSLSRYLHVTMTQLAGSAACLRFHQIGPRLARWLLMTQDRANSERFQVTHEFLAFMLGVRRVGITTAAASLQRQGLIEYHRGDITILTRRGLEKAACGCYASDRKVYAELLH